MNSEYIIAYISPQIWLTWKKLGRWMPGQSGPVEFSMQPIRWLWLMAMKSIFFVQYTTHHFYPTGLLSPPNSKNRGSFAYLLVWKLQHRRYVQTTGFSLSGRGHNKGGGLLVFFRVVPFFSYWPQKVTDSLICQVTAQYSHNCCGF